MPVTNLSNYAYRDAPRVLDARLKLDSHLDLLLAMNSLASRFSSTGVEAELRRAQALADDDEMTDAMWGSEAGLGTLASGHAFAVPSVPDVRGLSFRMGV